MKLCGLIEKQGVVLRKGTPDIQSEQIELS